MAEVILSEIDTMRVLVWVMFLVVIPAVIVWSKARNRAFRDRLERIEAKIDRLLSERQPPPGGDA